MRFLVRGLMVFGLLPSLLSASQTRTDLSRLLPDRVPGWAPAGDDRAFTRDTLTAYMAGTAETYLAYGFRRLLVREYRDPSGARLLAEIYDMGSAADAYGIFSNDPDGEPASVGREALYGAGLLRFWRGPYFVRLLAERETTETRGLVTDVGIKVAAAIPEEGSRPKLMDCLPKERLDLKSLRYFHKQLSLNPYYYLADENVLLLDEGTEVALGKYREGWDKSLLLVCRYRTPDDARRAFVKFGRSYFAGKVDAASGTMIERIENGEFAAARLTGACLILVFESSDRRSCEALLRAAGAKVRAFAAAER